MTVKSQLIQMIDFVPEGELPILLEVVRRFVPVDADDIATEDDLKAHRTAMEEYANGHQLGLTERGPGIAPRSSAPLFYPY